MTTRRKLTFAATPIVVAVAIVAVVATVQVDSKPTADAPAASGSRSSTAAPGARPTTVGEGALSDQPAPGPVRSPAAGTRPVRIQIPAIGVDSSLENLRVTRGGELAAPSRWQRAGWYADGIRPGMVGPAVIAGHVDSVNGPAVFFGLEELRRGNRVVVTRADGLRLSFVVDRSREYPKRTFPTDAVYGPTSQSVLRLITCAGDFDAGRHSYVDNLVVTTHLVTS